MLARLAILCLIAALVAAAPTRAASLDPAFGDGGRVVVDFGEYHSATAGEMALRPDGKIVAAGWLDGSFVVVRLLPDGSLDPSFGAGGIAQPQFGTAVPEAVVPALALQPDGKIVVAGPVAGLARSFDFGIVRLNADGSLDQSFGGGGKALIELGPGTDVATDVALQPDGKIVVGGYEAAADTARTDFAAVRLTAAGALDPTFGSGGMAIVPMVPDSPWDTASNVAVLPDGRVLLAGVTNRPATGFDIGLAWLLPTGQPDPAVGDQGRVVLALGEGARQEVVRSLVTLADGSFFVVGSSLQVGFGASQAAVVRFSAAGVPDASFAAGGQLLQSIGGREDTANGLVSDGPTSYVAVDSLETTTLPGASEPVSMRRLGVLAVDAAGRVDSTFGTDGTLLFNITQNGTDRAAGIAQRPDGELVELATVRPYGGTRSMFGFALIAPGSAAPLAPPPAPPADQLTPPTTKVAPLAAIAWPRNRSRVRRVLVLRGTAAATATLARVDLALVRRADSSCFYLTGPRPAFARRHARRGRCRALVWRRAQGTTGWRYALRRPLPKGSYTLYARAVARTGVQGMARHVTFAVR